MVKILNALFWILGVLLFAWALNRVDLASVGRLLAEIGFGFLLVIFIALVVSIFGALSWICAFKPEETRKFTLWGIWKIRQIGEAFNIITPLGTLGGEPVKGNLIKQQYGLRFRQGIASQVIQKTTTLVALILFLMSGMVLLFLNEGVDPQFRRICLAGLAIFSSLIFLFVLFQVTGFLNRLGSWERMWPDADWSKNTRAYLGNVGENLSSYYKKHRGRCAASTGFSFLGWVTGMVELQILLYFLGHSLSLADLWTVESLSQLVRSASFFIPLGIGAQETGLVLIFASMGLTADVGLVISLVRRLKELTWVGAGLFLGRRVQLAPLRNPKAGPSAESL